MVILGDFFQNLRGIGRHFIHLQPAQQSYVIDHTLVAWVRGSHAQHAILDRQRQNAVALYEMSRQQPDRFRGCVKFVVVLRTSIAVLGCSVGRRSQNHFVIRRGRSVHVRGNAISMKRQIDENVSALFWDDGPIPY